MSPAIALATLRLRLNSSFLAGQLALDLAAPVGLCLLARSLAGPLVEPRLPVAAFIFSGTMALAREPAYVILFERQQGMADLLRAAGVSRQGYLAAQTIGGFYFALFPLICAVLTALVTKVALPTGVIAWSALGLYLLFAHGLGLLLPTLFPRFGPLALAANLLLGAVMSLCPVLYPPQGAPELLRPILEFAPPVLAAQLATGASTQGLPLLALWAAAALGAGYALFRWRPT